MVSLSEVIQLRLEPVDQETVVFCSEHVIIGDTMKFGGCIQCIDGCVTGWSWRIRCATAIAAIRLYIGVTNGNCMGPTLLGLRKGGRINFYAEIDCIIA